MNSQTKNNKQKKKKQKNQKKIQIHKKEFWHTVATHTPKPTATLNAEHPAPSVYPPFGGI